MILIIFKYYKNGAYKSRALTNTKQKYVQIEKQILKIVFLLEKFHQYAYGRRTNIHLDHQPLEAIVKNPLEKMPKCLQGILLYPPKYISAVYVKGKHMPITDMLSQPYLTHEKGCQTEFEHVNMVSFFLIHNERLP